jgi:hypothetical protein
MQEISFKAKKEVNLFLSSDDDMAPNIFLTEAISMV